MKHRTGLPTHKQILAFIETSDQPAGKREIAKAFGLSGADKIALKQLLRDMGDDGLIEAAPGRAFHKLGGVPKVTVLRVVDVDDGGNVWAVPERWESEAPEPRLRVQERGRKGALGVGDRVLARTEEKGAGLIAHPMKKLLKGSELVLGVVHREGESHWLRPVDKRERRELPISNLGKAQVGDLVLAEKTGRPPRLSARVDTILGDPFAPRSFSLIAIHKLGIPHEFGERLLEEAERVAGLPLDPPRDGEGDRSPKASGGGGSLQGGGDGEPPPSALRAATSPSRGGSREDLTHIPIVAIDPADARDHDDAVWAAPDDDPANPGGWKAIVAIADVSFYVRPGSALDKEARRRGNSVYFPDQVVPMLPERLSAHVCSLVEGEDRAALACHLQVAKDGQLKSWRFTRARVRIAANIAYEDAQAAIDAAELLPGTGRGTETRSGGVEGAGHERSPAQDPLHHSPAASCPPPRAGEELDPKIVESTLKPLWACWQVLYKAREKRGPLDLDLPERRVVLDEKGRILSVAPRERLDAHKLIEDYMIAANVAAAKALEAKKAPVMYRDHEPPSREKLVALKEYLKTFDVEFALGQVVRPSTFNRIIERVGEADHKPEIMQQILRSQTQAYYGPENHGHFGLALGSYAHFTSPIRRYADLLVHRSLVRAYGLGEGGLTDAEAEAMDLIGESISQHERRAMEAERDTIDRYVAAFLSERVGELVDCRITGVQPFGFFATVEGLGGDGLVPVSTLGTEYFRYEEASQSLVGEETGERFTLGRKLTLRLAEANPVSGGLRFELPDAASTPRRDNRRGEEKKGRAQGKRGRPGNIRHQGKNR